VGEGEAAVKGGSGGRSQNYLVLACVWSSVCGVCKGIRGDKKVLQYSLSPLGGWEGANMMCVGVPGGQQSKEKGRAGEATPSTEDKV
jgi:hypothetical protein